MIAAEPLSREFARFCLFSWHYLQRSTQEALTAELAEACRSSDFFGTEDFTLQFRLAAIQDAEGITALVNAAFRKAESFFIDGDRIDTELVRSLMKKGQFLVADKSGNFSGCVYLEFRGERAYLGLLSVDPQLQKTGMGSALLKAAEERCAKAGCLFVDLRTVDLRTDNRAFYGRRGYVETATEPFPAELNPKLPCHFVNMSKRLG